MAKYLSLTGLQQYDTKIKEYVTQNAPPALYQHTINCQGQNSIFIATILSTTATPFDETALKQWLGDNGFVGQGSYYSVSGYCFAFSDPTQLFGIFVDQGDSTLYVVVGHLSSSGDWCEETVNSDGADFTDTVIEI